MIVVGNPWIVYPEPQYKVAQDVAYIALTEIPNNANTCTNFWHSTGGAEADDSMVDEAEYHFEGRFSFLISR